MLALVTLPTLGGGNRLRLEQYEHLLREHGIELHVSAFFDDGTYRILYAPGSSMAKVVGVLRGTIRRLGDLVRLRHYDLIVVYREAMPIGPPLLERAIARLGIPYVFDFDDAIWLAPIHPSNRRWAWLRHPSRVERTARMARAVIVGNEYLADQARQWNNDVTIIPTAVDTDRHRPGLADRPTLPRVIGWVGSSTTAPYLDLLDVPLARLAQRRRDILLRVVGGRHPHPTVYVDERPYRLDQEPADVSTFHVGVLPEPDDAWTRGKGAFKALLYMAAGLPVVASRVGVNPIVIEHGRTGFCVDSDDEWVEALLRLLDDDRLSREMGALVALGGYALVVEPGRVSRTFLRVLIAGVAPPQRSLAVGDLHLRARSDATFSRLRAAADWASGEGATAALLLGDLIERDDEADAVGRRLAAALRPLHPVYVSGNHELDRSQRIHWPLKRNDAALIRSSLAAHGIECADERVVTIGGVHFLGLSWQGWRIGPDPAALTQFPPTPSPRVLLTHSPDHVTGMRVAGVTFALCGHTHGGQVRLPLIGAPWTPALARLPRHSGPMILDGIPTYLTRGLSATFPIRFAAPPEVVLVEFASARGAVPAGARAIEQEAS